MYHTAVLAKAFAATPYSLDRICSFIWLSQPLFGNINHAWSGDLKASLIHHDSGTQVHLIDWPGVPASSLGCKYPHLQAIFDDDASLPAENKCSADPSATPIPPPTPVSLPSNANITGVTGQNQALSLDCESRTAVDWARFFGVSIPELEFYNHLPHSDNPEKGFVGNVNGAWGNIPPGDYGVHAEPVAALLRDYGLDARAYHSLRWDDIRFEIASGRPVIVWVTGSTNAGRYPSGAHGPPLNSDMRIFVTKFTTQGYRIVE